MVARCNPILVTMAHRTLHRTIEGQRLNPAARVTRSVRRSSLKVLAEQQQGPPPAWDRRVVVPEVQPRDTPKVGVLY